jgi:hypothetical protein
MKISAVFLYDILLAADVILTTKSANYENKNCTLYPYYFSIGSM